MRQLSFAVVLTIGYLAGMGGTMEAAAPDIAPNQPADGLCSEGMGLLGSGHPEDAMARFLSAIELDPKHLPSHVGLGHAYLAQDSLRAAEDAFRGALRRKKNHPPALNGLGLVFRQGQNELRWAIKYFKKATVADRSYSEAYYNLAQTYQAIEDTKELTTYRKLVKVCPGHEDAWFQIGRIRRAGIGSRYRDDGKAEEAFRKQLEINPGHMAARLSLGMLLKEAGETDDALDLLQPVVDRPNPYQRRSLLEMANVYQKRREYDRSEQLFDSYIDGLEDRERFLYYDLDLVAPKEAVQDFDSAPQLEWRKRSDRFWDALDPAPVTAANERRIEHCRRVAYAREHFGTFEYPWDDRGETYVRYGEPQHISTSEDIRFEMDAKVVAVKERLIQMAGTAVGALLQVRAGLLDDAMAEAVGSASTVRRQIAGSGHYVTAGDRSVVAARGARSSGQTGSKITDVPSGLIGAGSILGWPVYPVVDRVWEYWIYADVGPGIEITFTQPYYPGPFHYAEPPLGIGGAGDRTVELTWQRMNPRVVMSSVSAGQPEVYRPNFATGPLDFYFDTARFRGEGGQTDLEVYFGIPVRVLAYNQQDDGRHLARVGRGVALYDRDGVRVYRTDNTLELFSDGPIDTTRLAFAPVVDRLGLPPAPYRLSVQVLDSGSSKSQVYNQEVLLNAFPEDSLAISDIQFASLVRPASKGRFLKGDLAVLPNPIRSYAKGQPVYVYYEIYNLDRDRFGATHYRVAYEVRSGDNRSVGMRVLRSLGRLLGRQDTEQSIVIEYDHIGDQGDEQAYIQLDLSDTEPGEQIVKVTVTDDNAGSEVVASSTFVIR